LVPPFCVRPPRGPNPTIRLAGEPALFHIINHVQLIGFLGKDPEKRQVRGNGTNFTVLSVATQQSWKDSNDEWQARTEWHRVVAFNRLGESLADTLHKGDDAESGLSEFDLKEEACRSSRSNQQF